MTKISQLTNIGSALAADDEFVVRDVSDISTPNKKVTSSGIIDYIIAQGGVSGFSQIAAGVGPLSRVQATSSGATGTITFSTASATTLLERARIDSAGRVLVGTSTANTSGAKLQTSDGLTFPATAVASADPNTLDDYEEGVWTPVLRGGTTAGTYELSRAIGIYTKIGRQVTITMVLQLAGTITGGGTGYAQITGLPFPQAANSFPSATCALYGVDISVNYSTVQFSPITGSSTSTWFLGQTGDNIAPSDLPIDAFSASDQVFVTVNYIV